jgi:polysaccharide chain length determinant protein (PEP-CTERM system associated)
MNSKDETFNIAYYINLIFKRRWLIIIPFCLAMIVGIYLAITLPKIYRASTLILVEPQSVPAEFVREIVTSEIDARITTIQQQILSHTNLEKIIDQFKLFTGYGSENLFMADKVATMRNRIEVEVSRTRRQGPNAFSISYYDANPETAMKIANGLTTLFIDENLKIREAQALGTSDFLQAELEAMRKRLVVVEEKLREYRERYRGELPEQLDSNLRILANLQQQLNEREARLSDERNRLIEVENQIQTRKQMLETSSIAQSATNEIVTLDQHKQQLENLQSSYTEKHPDVIRLKEKIASLEAMQTTTQQGAGSTGQDARFLEDRALNEQITQRTEIRIALSSLADDIAKIRQQISTYQQRVERTPKREEELMALRRDYDNIQESYNSLLNRKLEAEIAVNMEKKQKGEQFRVIDPARLPHKPISPDLRRLFMMVLAAGLGFGAGLIFLLDFFNNTLKDPEKFEDDLGVPVLATIPKVYQKKDLRLKRLNEVLTAVSIVAAICLLTGFAALVFNGVEQTIAAVRPYMTFLKI